MGTKKDASSPLLIFVLLHYTLYIRVRAHEAISQKIPYTSITFIHNTLRYKISRAYRQAHFAYTLLTLLLPRLSSFNKKSECHGAEILPYSVNGNKTLTTRRRPTYTIQHSENKQNTKIFCKVKTSQGKINEMRENMQENKTT